MAPLSLSFRCSNGRRFEVEVSDGLTVRELKASIAEKAGVEVDQQRLIVKGRVLTDAGTLEHFGLQNGDAVHLIHSNTSATRPREAPSQSAASNPFAGLLPGNAPGLGGAQSQGGGLGGFRPEMISSLMESPAMQAILDNPEIMRSMMMSNPEMRSLLEQNPQLRHALNDPELLRQSMNAARNPAMMQEMMRNQDRALANIESLPGGYNALRRMYHDVQEPMMEAGLGAAEDGENSTTATANAAQGSNTESSGQQEPQRQPMPNPWNSGGGGNPSSSRGTTTGSSQNQSPFGGALGGLGGLAGLGGGNQGSGNANNPMASLAASLFGGQSQRQGQSSSGPAPNPFSFLQGLAQPGQVQQPGSTGSSAPTRRSTGPKPTGPNPWAAPGSADSAEVVYKSQLESLESMGFPDTKKNIQALLRTSGNVEDAVEALIEDMSK
mmetsp:Transcript_10060/g.17681  ORF Transcript_10060/g.17681 Transcript_10060/m.17681 type:complete len:438 (+) Transcript_10060:136-1449(+)